MPGACTETILLGRRAFRNVKKNADCSATGGSHGVDNNADELWSQLLSFFEAGFLMGVATNQGGDGLVVGHAYSVLDGIQVPDFVVGLQLKVADYFRRSKKKRIDSDCKNELETLASIAPCGEVALRTKRRKNCTISNCETRRKNA